MKSWSGKHPGGRPPLTPFDPERAAEILRLVSNGTPLYHACRVVALQRDIIRNWVVQSPEFNVALHAARIEGLEVLADEVLVIADEVRGCVDNAKVQAARLAVDSRKWILSKLAPERYGERVELTGAGGKDLLPSPETAIPKLMAVLAVLMPNTANSELHALATTMSGKLNGLLPAPDK